MIAHRDPGDENDYPETIEEHVAYLRREFARHISRGLALSDAEFARLMRKPFGRVQLARARPVTGGDCQDPGDESDAQILVRFLSFTVEIAP